ncbi:atherin-like [Chiroxiphia lanceolata]|uniref:atherin-like n=1 Tax=Chiroxiphia lanceolata TaxID=296741 RepID=UPI0013CEBC28|nr:atherin-like [Chiroxiphia lanceolata]XP_032541253.1 atherin-like [Chiroxiphia lanceolata]XP_032541264.1 atherin-like [Chiroxiphia lanceolata]
MRGHGRGAGAAGRSCPVGPFLAPAAPRRAAASGRAGGRRAASGERSHPGAPALAPAPTPVMAAERPPRGPRPPGTDRALEVYAPAPPLEGGKCLCFQGQGRRNSNLRFYKINATARSY